ncbi:MULTISPECIES: FcoT family thioesterase [Streptomyces]|uniref:(2E)-enoyl-[ACP] glycyltransferase n=1 Tax=Streptomyces ramulosus TaxID=47762 RepID=A0ABW1FDK5_9ACTN
MSATGADGPDLLTRVLAPYKAHCAYLRSAEVTVDGETLTARGEFAIPESCYIDDTGHLNSVEVNICYNQLMYYALAVAVRDRLLPQFAEWTMEDYWKRQLPDILIVRFESRFPRPVDPRAFQGEFTLKRLTRRTPRDGAPLLIAETTHRYHDAHGGRCHGEATLALTRLP